MNRHQQAEAERKYKLFEEITEELSRIKQARCEKANSTKEKKALWYKKQKENKKRYTEFTGRFTSHESDFLCVTNFISGQYQEWIYVTGKWQ